MANSCGNSFASCYMELCREQRQRPLPMICVTLPHSLDFTTDRVKMDDWAPILNSLSLDRTLRSISVRSKYQYRKLLEHANSESKARAVGKAPVVLTRFLVEWLSHSVAQCVRNSSSLTSLELEGIPVPADCLAVLCVGLAGTKSLQHLSLQRCYIGDAGCELICRTVADVQSIKSLNLSQCDLTSESGPALASALSRQKLSLYHDAWKQSLRYREPKLESMPGLRRLTLNGNGKLGNEAVSAIIESIRDSLWFKALDLQQCGLNDELGQEILDLLEHNKTLVIVDVRMNSALRDETLNEIGRRLERNDLRCKSEYRWLSLPQQKDSSSIAGKRVSSAGNLQKQQQKQTEETNKAGGLVRPKSGPMIIRQVKRPPAPIVYKKPLIAPAPQLAKRIKMKPPLPAFERRPRQPVKPIQPQTKPEPAPKVSLHLDLQSQIQSLADTTQTDTAPPLEEHIPVKAPPSSTIRSARVDDQKPSHESDSQRLQETLRQQLLEAREERERLLDEISRNELILSEERARREFAEAKLRSAKGDLTQMEESLRQRERDQRGYLLISQKSMEEICQSFGRLLDIIEPQSDNSLARIESEEDSLAREDIKRRFALIIRKTKSENLKRGGYFVDDERVWSRLQMTARYGRSEGNIRSPVVDQQQQQPAQQQPPPERLTIGDTGETMGLPQLVSSFREHGFDAVRMEKGAGDSPRDRARAIFASLVNGDALLGFGR